MKTCIFISLLLVSSLHTFAETLTNAIPAGTNILAICLVTDKVSTGLHDGTASPAGLSLKAPPILADADFVAWDVTNHTCVITPTAAKRVAGSCSMRVVPFVLLSFGEPIYVGLFGTSFSSSSAAVPVILTDEIVIDCFMGFTNVPGDVWRMIGQADPGVTDRLLALTNATTNVTLKIDRGYPPPDGFGLGKVDRRGDKRIAVAVEKLFRNRKPAPRASETEASHP